MTLGQRILDRLKELGKNQAWLCTKIEGLEIGTLNALVQRKSKNSSFALVIAKELGVSLEWLVTGQGNKETNGRRASPPETQESALSDWPFARISKDRFMSLSETQRAFIEGAVLVMVDREIERNAEAEPNRSAG